MMHDWSNWGFGGWSGMWLGPLFMLLVVVAVIVLGVALVRWMVATVPTSSNVHRPPSARDILDQRFARGEIDADEYESRKRAIES